MEGAGRGVALAVGRPILDGMRDLPVRIRVLEKASLVSPGTGA